MKSKAQLIQFTDKQKRTKKVTWVIYGQDKEKLKKYWKVGIELSTNGNTKIPQIYTLPQFTDSTHVIYWPVKMA